ncbi:RidA family protein [Mesorhizobium intechi]|uniref:RidA family protein n=1 Tax=Mesorhizobium intechi TaxID=537601 RepID=UPI000CB458AA|nr:RidA family protein [Mesorhizobium intechi]TSE12153.1 RidA family protein [Mesorhizobium intechi]
MNSKPQIILAEDAPAPAGHYSQAVRSGNSLYISGQLPIKADKAPLADTSFEIQARLTIANMLAILEAAGGKPDDICRVTAYIVGVQNWPEFNRIYGEMLGKARPARTVVPVPELHYGYLVEIDAIASLPGHG